MPNVLNIAPIVTTTIYKTQIYIGSSFTSRFDWKKTGSGNMKFQIPSLQRLRNTYSSRFL